MDSSRSNKNAATAVRARVHVAILPLSSPLARQYSVVSATASATEPWLSGNPASASLSALASMASPAQAATEHEEEERKPESILYLELTQNDDKDRK